MQVINSVIFNLLASHKRVVLPGFGTLSVDRTEASVENNGVIKPPVNNLSFVSETSFGTNVIDAILNELDLDRPDVEYAYQKWLSAIKDNAADGIFTIDGVCRITSAAGGSYSVKAYKELDELLNPLRADEIRAIKVKPRKKSRRGVLWFAVGFVGLWAAVALYFFFLVGKNSPRVGQELPMIDEVVLPEAMPDTVPAAKADTISAEDVIARQLMAQAEQKVALNNFYIIAGVFSTRENAQKYIDTQTDFPESTCRIIISPRGLYMVGVKGFPDRESAEAQLGSFQEKVPGAWIFNDSKEE